MQKHLEQALHNEKFHKYIEELFSEQFYDWKITVLFYIALHYLKALADSKQIDFGETHFDIEQNVNPDRSNAKMKISRNAWREYKNLFYYSRLSRYEGINSIENFEKIKKIDHSYCKVHLNNFKSYILSQNIKTN